MSPPPSASDCAPSLRILHIILSLRPTNGQYNEHCLPLCHERDLSICTYFRSQVTPPRQIKLFDGDGTVRGFHRAISAALAGREYDVIHVHTPHAGALLLMSLLLGRCFRKWRSRTVHTVQNCYLNHKFRNRLLFLPAFPYARRVVFCSHASYRSFPAPLRRLCRGRTAVVQNAVDMDRIRRVGASVGPRTDARFTVSSVGLIPIKNPVLVAKAFKEAGPPDRRLLMLGEGPLQATVQRQFESADNHASVTFTGLVERDDVFRLLHHSDLFVSASYGEGLPVAVLEAMACAIPVVLSDIEPHREIAEGTDFIPLVAPDDVDGFARHIQRFADMPAEQRQAIGNQCRQLVQDRFSLSVMHEGLANVYRQVMTPRTHAGGTNEPVVPTVT